jgi:hypothetical protein
VTLGPEERHKARQIMKAQRVSYKEALAIMSRSAAVKRAQRVVRGALAKELKKPLSERRLEPPPSNVWYNRD